MSSPMQQHGSKYFSPGPLPPQGMGSKIQNLFFSEHSHVEYQIKGNQICSNIKSNILPTAPSIPTPFLPSPGCGVNWSKLTFFKTWSRCLSNYI